MRINTRARAAGRWVWTAVGVGENVRGRVGFASWVVGGVAAGSLVLWNEVGPLVAAVVVALVAVSLVGGVVALRAVRADERRRGDARVADAEAGHSQERAAHAAELAAQRERVADASRHVEARLEDQRRHHDEALRLQRQDVEDRVHRELARDNQLATVHGTLVPRYWNAIIMGSPAGNAPAVDYVPPGYSVRMSPDPITDEHGNSVSGGGRAINSRGSMAMGGTVGGPDPTIPVNYGPRDGPL